MLLRPNVTCRLEATFSIGGVKDLRRTSHAVTHSVFRGTPDHFFTAFGLFRARSTADPIAAGKLGDFFGAVRILDALLPLAVVRLPPLRPPPPDESAVARSS
jgi:hypothetical protein